MAIISFSSKNVFMYAKCPGVQMKFGKTWDSGPLFKERYLWDKKYERVAVAMARGGYESNVDATVA